MPKDFWPKQAIKFCCCFICNTECDTIRKLGIAAQFKSNVQTNKLIFGNSLKRNNTSFRTSLTSAQAAGRNGRGGKR